MSGRLPIKTAARDHQLDRRLGEQQMFFLIRAHYIKCRLYSRCTIFALNAFAVLPFYMTVPCFPANEIITSWTIEGLDINWYACPLWLVCLGGCLTNLYKIVIYNCTNRRYSQRRTRYWKTRKDVFSNAHAYNSIPRAWPKSRRQTQKRACFIWILHRNTSV